MKVTQINPLCLKKVMAMTLDMRYEDIRGMVFYMRYTRVDLINDNWEMRKYFQLTGMASRSEDVFKWWARQVASFPALAAMAQDYLAIPATNVPCSVAFNLKRQNIGQLKYMDEPAMVCKLMSLNSWMQQIQ